MDFFMDQRQTEDGQNCEYSSTGQRVYGVPLVIVVGNLIAKNVCD